MTSAMESFPLFFKIRAITFACIMLFSFLWLVLLCVEMFTRWGVSDQISRSLMILFIFTNGTTLIMLPMLILVQFRIWLDAARLLLLFILQIGSATAGSVWGPKIQCPDQTPDDLGICQLISAYTIIACWIIPAMLVFYSTYFAAVVYLQSRIPVVVEPELRKHRLGIDLERGFTGSFSSWSNKMKEIIRVQGSNTSKGVPLRPLVLPAMVHIRQSSLPQSSAPQRQSTLLNPPLRQSTMSPFLRAGQQPLHALPSIPNRHHSLPVFKHGDGPHLRPMLALPMPRPLATNASTSPQTPSSHSYSTPSLANPQNQLPSFEPSVAAAQSPRDHQGVSSHLSMMPLPSSPKEMDSAEGSSRARPARARLSKPLPVHFM